ncbi:MAG: adenylate/guanylate cyclase domain-containing protein [Dehalococcoidia bacterium]|nr:adenylate/guanylate cyclase domain-containing protein [Dehalococcoidia bacterium]
MEQQIRFCTTSDGVRIAYATVGEGPPLVVVPGWFTHLQFEWNHPDVRAFWSSLADQRRVIRFDPRGVGLSDRDASDHTLEARLRDIEAVVNALRLEQCSLLGMSQGGATAIAFAARSPSKVERLILYGSYARVLGARKEYQPMLALLRSNWRAGSAATTAGLVPTMYPAEAAFFTDLLRAAVSGPTAADILEEISKTDVTAACKEVRAPTLVIHRRGDPVHPIDLARELAALIPDARMEVQEGEVYVPWWGESNALVAMIEEFLGGTAARKEEHGATDHVHTILFTDIESSSALRQRLGDARAQELVRTHNAIVREALKARGGAEIKHTGDGIMASFASATRALECAVAIQRGVATHVAAHPDAPLGVYVGLNAGEPIAEERDLFGTSVDLARRLCDEAGPSEILVSNVVRELTSGKGFLFSDRGAAPLKGFEDPVRVYEVRWQE